MIALLTLLAASSGAVDCKALDSRATQDGARIPGDEAVYEVVGTGRAPFYSAPDLACPMRGVFIIPKDQVIAYIDYGDFTSVMFLNLKTGADTGGWVQTSRLKPTGTGISPSEAVMGSAPVTGDWCSREDSPGTFEEFSLEQEGEKRSFSSWLHARPEHSGTWRLDGRKLRITTGQKLSFEFKVLSVSDKELQLLSNDGDSEHYFRDGCALFSEPFGPGFTDTRLGTVEWASEGDDEDGRQQTMISVAGTRLRSFRADTVDLIKLESKTGPEYVLVQMWKGALNCHFSFAIVELREGAAPRISDEFGECTELDDARIDAGSVRVDATETLGGKEVSFRYMNGTISQVAR